MTCELMTVEFIELSQNSLFLVKLLYSSEFLVCKAEPWNEGGHAKVCKNRCLRRIGVGELRKMIAAISVNNLVGCIPCTIDKIRWGRLVGLNR